VSNPGGNGWAKAGIMFRETTAANSKYVYALLSVSNGTDLQYRTTTGGSAGRTGVGSPTPGPVGLRLTRQGDTFTAAADTGGGYASLGSISFTMNGSALLGFAVTSHAGAPLSTADFMQPVSTLSGGLYAEVSLPNFFATPGAENSRYATNTPPYIRNVDTTPNDPVSAGPIIVRAKITDSDGIAAASLSYQIIRPGGYIRIGDAAYQTSWTTVAMTPATTPTYYVATIPAQPHRTLVRYRISARDGAGQTTTVPYSDDPEPNYARFVYDGVPSYVASPQPGVQPPRTHTVLTKVPVFQLIANGADVNEAQTVAISDKVERRQFKWYGTVYLNGKVYDHIRFRMRGGTWRYRYNKRMWKFRFNRGHYLEFIHNDGEKYADDLRTLNLNACIQPPGNVPSWVSSKYGGDASQRGEAGIVEKACFWLWQRVGAIAPDTTWIHFRIVDNASETGADQYSGDFFGLYLAIQGMDERALTASNRPVGNFFKIDSFGALPASPPWFVEASNCSQLDPQTDITEFRRQYAPKSGYPTPTKQWWEQNFDLDAYYSARTVVDFSHHGDLYNTSTYDGVGTGKNYYYYHNPATGKWEIVYWDVDLTFGTDHGDASSPFRDRIVRNSSFPDFQIAYKNRLREVIQLQFCEAKFFPKLDEWRNLLVEIAAADQDRWDYVPATSSNDTFREWRGHFRPLDTRLADVKYWIRMRLAWLTGPPSNWSLETSSGWPQTTCWDVDIPSTPTLTSPAAGLAYTTESQIVLVSSAYSDPNGNPHTASKWIATKVPGNELKPEWSSGITTTSLTAKTIPSGALQPGQYWLRVRHMDSTGRWSWWSPTVTIKVDPVPYSARTKSWALYQ
jgi:hypothetical protein